MKTKQKEKELTNTNNNQKTTNDKLDYISQESIDSNPNDDIASIRPDTNVDFHTAAEDIDI